MPSPVSSLLAMLAQQTMRRNRPSNSIAPKEAVASSGRTTLSDRDASNNGHLFSITIPGDEQCVVAVYCESLSFKKDAFVIVSILNKKEGKTDSASYRIGDLEWLGTHLLSKSVGKWSFNVCKESGTYLCVETFGGAETGQNVTRSYNCVTRGVLPTRNSPGMKDTRFRFSIEISGIIADIFTCLELLMRESTEIIEAVAYSFNENNKLQQRSPSTFLTL